MDAEIPRGARRMFGLKDVFCGVPVKLGRKGLEQVVKIKLTPDEQKALEASAEAVRSTMKALGTA